MFLQFFAFQFGSSLICYDLVQGIFCLQPTPVAVGLTETFWFLPERTEYPSLYVIR